MSFRFKSFLVYKLLEPLKLRVARYSKLISSSPLTTDTDFVGLVSIILPTFNRSEILFSRAIPSVLNQTYKNWELLVVAHGCTDSTITKVERLSSEDPRVRLIKVARGDLGYPPSAENHWLVGPVKPINAGLDNVSGSWIARIDDDDEWHSNHLEMLLNLLASSGAEFASSSYQVDMYGDRQVFPPKGEPRVGGVQTWLYRSYMRFFRANINSWQKKWNRVNDTDLQERFVYSGVKFAYTDEVTVTIRPRPGEKNIGSKAYLSDKVRYENKYKAQKSHES
jgi:glycosyltransferase involved in cell wall biosynthesis